MSHPARMLIGCLLRWEMDWWEMVIGVLQVFILGWLFGALVAFFYNYGLGGGER